MFWASYLAQEMYDNMLQWYDAFKNAAFVSSLQIHIIAGSFTPTSETSTFTIASFLSAFSTELSTALSVVPIENDAVNTFGDGLARLKASLAFYPQMDSLFRMRTTLRRLLLKL